LPALVEGFRGSGLSVVLAAEPASSAPDSEPSGSATELFELPESLQLAAFRIVQEGLTNVLKHAGAAAQARVAVGVVHQGQAAAELLVEISDDGIGPGVRANARSDPGHGLIGIRERVELFGGRAEIGPGSGRGFSVRARFPLPVDQPA
jgi:signal transduction histidine kinase